MPRELAHELAGEGQGARANAAKKREEAAAGSETDDEFPSDQDEDEWPIGDDKRRSPSSRHARRLNARRRGSRRSGSGTRAGPRLWRGGIQMLRKTPLQKAIQVPRRRAGLGG